MTKTTKQDKKGIALISVISAFIAGLCCFAPLVLFLVGAAGLTFVGEFVDPTFAGDFANNLYYDYRWVFRFAGIAFLVLAYGIWYRSRAKSCTLDQKKRLRRKMLNWFIITFFIFIFAYILWTYVIVEWLGIKLGLWQWSDDYTLGDLW